jgi:hypothetical protein
MTENKMECKIHCFSGKELVLIRQYGNGVKVFCSLAMRHHVENESKLKKLTLQFEFSRFGEVNI